MSTTRFEQQKTPILHCQIYNKAALSLNQAPNFIEHNLKMVKN